MFRRHIRQQGAPDTHVLSIKAMRAALSDLGNGGHQGFTCSGVAPLDRINPNLRNGGEIKLPQWTRPPSSSAEDPQINLWISSGRLQSGMHYDEAYNSLTVLKGTKHVYLFAPSQSRFLYQTVQGLESNQMMVGA
jgi:hypothetical protein